MRRRLIRSPRSTATGIALAALALSLSSLNAVPASNGATPLDADSPAALRKAPQAGSSTDSGPRAGDTDPTRRHATGQQRGKAKDPTLGRIGQSHGTDVPGGRAGAAPGTVEPFAAPTAPDPAAVRRIRDRLGRTDTVRVIVMTDAPQRPEGRLGRADRREQRADIAASLAALSDRVEDRGARELSTLDVVPSAVYEVGSRGLDSLLSDPHVVSVVPDGQMSGTLSTSTGVIDSDLLNAAGVRGDGFNGGAGGFQVAVIDSGVDGGHAALSGKIVAQGCWVTNFSCPGGTNATTAVGSGEECTHSSDCDHGTHVAGISSGRTFTGGHEGVADGSNVVALKVAQDNPSSDRWTAMFSSIDSALQHTLNLRNGALPRIASVNISIGTSTTYAPGDAACNAIDPTTVSLFQQLQSAGVAVVVAAGNNGSSTSMSFPGCASNAFAIGATDDADVPASFTNSSSGMRWWAPGVSVDAPIPTGTNHGFKNGTSMAAPHVAGSFALLRECVDGNGVPITNAAAAARLDATGVNVTRNGVTRKRINVLDAATGTVNNNDFAAPEVLSGPGPINDFDFNVCADAEPGEPGPFSVDNSVWWTWTAPSTSTATISTEDSGTFLTTFDTQLTVYRGTSLGTLQALASDDDSGTGLRSLVQLPVQAGTTYRIKVDGFAASNGLMNLHLETGPAPSCQGLPATMVGTVYGETTTGTAGDDVIWAGAGNDIVNGGGGNDRICGGEGNDRVNGQLGDDGVYGDQGADVVGGNEGNDVLLGNAGGGDTNDLNDILRGGLGNDTLDGWVGNDSLEGGPGNDTLLGAAGIDKALYSTATSAVTADLGAGSASGGAGTDFLNQVEQLVGSRFNDVLRGSPSNNLVQAGDGNDRLLGLEGVDNLQGQNGNDTVEGGIANDVLNGGPGVDIVSFLGSATAVNVNLTTGTAVGQGSDSLAALENATGSNLADTLLGNAATNRLNGANGNDLIRGGGARDLLFGQANNDRLFGEAGNDALDGGANTDSCDGGLGTDTRVACESWSNIP